jgi:ParB family transcriptional regulator, chromosome partitioning protein
MSTRQEAPAIRSFEKREYAMIPLDKIRVLNPRSRDREQFKENVKSIGSVGLRKPVVVNTRNLKRTGYYELVCGQGRFEAFRELKKETIPAELISCTRKEALLYSLVENMARVPPGTMWFAHELQRLRDAGWELKRIAAIAGCTPEWVRGYLHLVDWGEERLIAGVERGVFPISFAIRVAEAGNGDMQNILMDAYDAGVVGTKNLPAVRKIIEARQRVGKTSRRPKEDVQADPVRKSDYSLKDLKDDIRRITEEKEDFAREAEGKEIRLYAILNDLDDLKNDAVTWEIVATEGLSDIPQLSHPSNGGRYNHAAQRT